MAGRLKPSQMLLMAHDKAGKVSGIQNSSLNEMKFYEVTLVEQLETGLRRCGGRPKMNPQRTMPPNLALHLTAAALADFRVPCLTGRRSR